MSEEEPIKVKTINKYLEAVQKLTEGDSHCLFRGQVDGSWSLASSARRSVKKPMDFIRHNEDLIDNTRDKGYGHDGGRDLYDLEVLAKLQHLGAATVFIDFTRNLFVALWFAVESGRESDGKDGKIFIVGADDVSKFRLVNKQQKKEGIAYFFALNRNTKRSKTSTEDLPYWLWEAQSICGERIIKQSSIFVFGRDGMIRKGDYKEIIIDKGSKERIRKELDRLHDIKEETLFPDFPGWAKANRHSKPHVESAQQYYRDGDDYFRKGDHQSAIAAYTWIIEKEPSAPAYNLRGFVYNDMGKYKEAIEDYAKALEIDPENAAAYNNRGFAYNDMGEYSKAIDDYTEALKIDKKYAHAYNNRGVTYNNMGKYKEAIDDYTEALKLDKEYAHAYNNRGITYNNMGQYKEAIEYCTRALEINPKYADAYYNRGTAYFGQDKYPEAVTDYTRVLEIDPEHANAHSLRGLARIKMGEYSEAIEDCTQAIKINPKYFNAYNNRGLAYYSQGKWAEAIKDCTEAIKTDPKSATSYNLCGLAHSRMGKYKEAITDHTHAIELNSEYAHAYYGRSFAEYKSGNKSSAQKGLLTALQLAKDQGLTELVENIRSAMKALGMMD